MEEYTPKWIIDEFIRLSGFQARNPDLLGLQLEWGTKWGHATSVARKIRSFDMVETAWFDMAERVRKLAVKAEEADHKLTALEYYFLASIYYCRAQWPIWEENRPELAEYHRLKNECYEKVIELNPYPIQRVEIPLGGKSIPGILHLPSKEGKFPLVVIIPGMDQTKEETLTVLNNRYIRRGIACLSVDGPGQGEAISLRKIKFKHGAYEELATSIYDTLEKHPNIDPKKIGLFGNSFGSYLATTMASAESRFAVCGTALAAVEPGMNTLLNEGYPSFKSRLKYMTGIKDEEEFQGFRKGLTLVGKAEKIKQPYLMLAGQFDNHSPLKYTKEHYNRMTCPREFTIYSGEYHTLSKVAGEAFDKIADWFRDRFDGKEMKTGWFVEPPI